MLPQQVGLTKTIFFSASYIYLNLKKTLYPFTLFTLLIISNRAAYENDLFENGPRPHTKKEEEMRER